MTMTTPGLGTQIANDVPECASTLPEIAMTNHSCIALVRAVADNSDEMLAAVHSSMAAYDFSLVPSVQSVLPRDISAGAFLGVVEELPQFQCTRGASCDIKIAGNDMLAAGNKMLILQGERAICGPTVPWPAAALASERASGGFIENPATSTAAVTAGGDQPFGLKEPSVAGYFALCYCQLGAVGVAGGCSRNGDYFQPAGSLFVRGPPGGAKLLCRAMTDCRVRVEGLGLTAWDRLLIVSSAESCGNASSSGLTAIPTNPAGTVVGIAGDTDLVRHFDVGVPQLVGSLRLCYCVSDSSSGDSASSSTSCSSPEEFTVDAGTLVVRGPEPEDAREFHCPKTELGAAREVICNLKIAGVDMWHELDGAMVVESDGGPCGQAQSVIAGIILPIPAMVNKSSSNQNTSTAWYADVPISKPALSRGIWSISQAIYAKTFRVCWCSATWNGACDEEDKFFYDIGRLTVAGAKGAELRSCEDGQACSVNISGFGLRANDHIALLGPVGRCGIDPVDLDSLGENPVKAAKVAADGSSAVFDLGRVAPTKRGELKSFRICYCPSFDGNEDGSACNVLTEFTHSAGSLNMMKCGERPSEESAITPPVEDIFGDPGKPTMSFHVMGATHCAGMADEADEADNDFVAAVPSSGSAVTMNSPGTLATKLHRCKPSLDLKPPEMANSKEVFFDVSLEADSHAGPVAVLLSDKVRLVGRGHVEDTLDQAWRCPAWTIDVVPLACTPMPTIVLGLLLHLLVGGVAAYHICRRKIMSCLTHWCPTCVGEKKPAASSAVAALPGTAEAGNETAAETEARLQAAALLKERVVLVFSSGRVFVQMAILRIGVIAACLFAIGLPLASQVALHVACIGINLLSQFFLIKCSSGTLQFLPCLFSTAAAIKLHLDLFLPVLARAHHSEFWRLAGMVALLNVLFVQAVWPACSLLSVLQPLRRRAPAGATASESVPLPPLPHPGDPASGEIPLPPLDLGHGRPKTPATAPASLQTDADRPTSAEGSTGSPDGGQSQPSKDGGRERPGFCGDLQRRLQMMTLPSQAELPEGQRNRRMAAAMAFLEATGCHAVSAAAEKALEDPGDDVSYRLARRWTVVRLAIGGLDLTALQALFVALYSPRLAAEEMLAMCLGVGLGLLQAMRTGTLLVALDLAEQLFMGNVLLVVPAVLVGLATRLLLILPMLPQAGGCPWFTWPLIFWFASVPALWLPLLAAYTWHRRRLRTKEQHEQSCLMLQKAIFEGREAGVGGTAAPVTLMDGMKDRKTGDWATSWEARTLASAYTPEQRLAWMSKMQLDPEDPLESDRMMKPLRLLGKCINDPHMTMHEALDKMQGVMQRTEKALRALSLAEDHDERRNRLEAMCRTLEDLPELIKYPAVHVPDETKANLRDAYDHLRGKLKDEIQWTSWASSTTGLATSWRFRVASPRDRLHQISKVFPELPGVYLVHWEVLADLRRLPTFADRSRFTELSEAVAQHEDKVVVTMVIHSALQRMVTSADHSETLAAQLAMFAEWYRKRWGSDLQPYFWIDACCLPPTSNVEEEKRVKVEAERVDINRLFQAKGMNLQLSRPPGARAHLETKLPKVSQMVRDAILPTICASSDAVVICETPQPGNVGDNSWVRAAIGVASKFAPPGRGFYTVGKTVMPSSVGAYLATQRLQPLAESTSGSIPRKSCRSKMASVFISPAYTTAVFGTPDKSGAMDAADSGSWRVVAREAPRSISHPLQPEAMHSDVKADAVRIARMVELCRFAPSPNWLRDDFHRPPVEFGSTRLLTHRIELELKREEEEKPDLSGQLKLRNASDTESEADEPANKLMLKAHKANPASIGGRSIENEHDVKHGNTLEERMIATYYGQANKPPSPRIEYDEPDALQAAMPSAPARFTGSPPRAINGQNKYRMVKEGHLTPVEPWPRPMFFHKEFISVSARLSPELTSVEQLATAGAPSGSGGGIAVSSKPLPVYDDVAPDSLGPLPGVAFEVVVNETDSRWSAVGGLAIGFTSQNPEDWQAKKAKPKRASQMPQTWVCGYTGRWFFERRSAPIKTTEWQPADLAPGDVITAVAVGKPFRVLRVLVNGILVAEETCKTARFPDPEMTPLWGIVDIHGTCAKISLTEAPAPGVPPSPSTALPSEMSPSAENTAADRP
eukprot:TRINITY_DN49873_c0_g2_i1.p1 TRINITY_DN49873_c0_g2~~TRINITY_DN49873_c0_g2_i1.p1  ORF type:complete len:2135 (-),score=414.14 TRINITY_DN49873_c0_g2_i1:80-6484(-)